MAFKGSHSYVCKHMHVAINAHLAAARICLHNVLEASAHSQYASATTTVYQVPVRLDLTRALPINLAATWSSSERPALS